MQLFWVPCKLPLAIMCMMQCLLLQVPERASMVVPAYSFPEKFSSFSFLSLLTKAEVIAALVKVRTECNKVSNST